jgi:DNA topoisomerase-1
VTDPEVGDRIVGLVIPPAWDDVWISPWPNGHIQAVGTDSAGRRRYRYHDAWRVQRAREKFERILRFGWSLPPLRSVVDGDLAADGAPRTKVLSAAVRLLDLGFSESGASSPQRNTKPLAWRPCAGTTCRCATMRWSSTPAKGSIRRTVTVADPVTFRLLSQQHPGGLPRFLYRSADLRSIRRRRDDCPDSQEVGRRC